VYKFCERNVLEVVLEIYVTFLTAEGCNDQTSFYVGKANRKVERHVLLMYSLSNSILLRTDVAFSHLHRGRRVGPQVTQIPAHTNLKSCLWPLQLPKSPATQDKLAFRADEPFLPPWTEKGARWSLNAGPFPDQQHQSAHSIPSLPMMPAAALAFSCSGTHSLNPNNWQMMMFFLTASIQRSGCSL